MDAVGGVVRSNLSTGSGMTFTLEWPGPALRRARNRLNSSRPRAPVLLAAWLEIFFADHACAGRMVLLVDDHPSPRRCDSPTTEGFRC
jgi:hypothetical protein